LSLPLHPPGQLIHESDNLLYSLFKPGETFIDRSTIAFARTATIATSATVAAIASTARRLTIPIGPTCGLFRGPFRLSIRHVDREPPEFVIDKRYDLLGNAGRLVRSPGARSQLLFKGVDSQLQPRDVALQPGYSIIAAVHDRCPPFGFASFGFRPAVPVVALRY
jgi:hypothetical protein